MRTFSLRIVSLLCVALIMTLSPIAVFAAPETQPKETKEKKIEKVEKIIHISEDGTGCIAPSPHGVKAACENTGGCSGGCSCQGGHAGNIHGNMLQPMLMAGHHGSGHDMHGMLAMAHAMDLTDAQKDRIEDIQHATKLAMLDLEAALSKEKLNLNKMIHDDADLTAIKKHLKALMEAQYELKLRAITSQRDLWDVFSDEQKENFKSQGSMHEFKWIGTDCSTHLEKCGTADACMSIEKCISIDDASCGEKEIKVMIEEGGKPCEKKVIIIEEDEDE
jgi:Spy/CpxP family protein refolding chaperone